MMMMMVMMMIYCIPGTDNMLSTFQIFEFFFFIVPAK